MHNNSFKCPVNFLDKILVWLTNHLLLSIQEAHLPFPFIRVPKVFQHLTRKRVLTMEWIIGESPTDLLSVSTGNSIDHGSRYTERQQFDAKRRLLDLVCNKDLHTYPLYLALTLVYPLFPGWNLYANYHYPRAQMSFGENNEYAILRRWEHHWLNIIPGENAEPKRDLLV